MTRPTAAPAAFVLLGAFLFHGCSQPPTVAYVQPHREDVVSYVTTNGQVEAGERAEVFAETTGRVVEVSVEEGRHVKRGERLLTIDDRMAREELNQAQARLEGAHAELNGLEQGGSPNETARARDRPGQRQTVPGTAR